MNDQSDIDSFDTLIQTNRLQILKTALPYISLSGQRFLSVCVKILELKNTMALYQQDEASLSACSLQKENGNILDLLQDIRKYCPADKQESIDQILNFANMYQMFQTYQSMTQEMEEAQNENPNFNKMEHLKSMLPPEQRNIFETYLSSI